MEETAAQGIISPVLSDTLLFLNIALSIILLFAFAYLWTTRHQTGEIGRLNDKIKRLSADLKELSERVDNIKIPQKVETVPEPAPFGLDIGARKEQAAAAAARAKIPVGEQAWSRFVDDYNYIAASMQVPGQLAACQRFVDENELRTLRIGITGNLLPVTTIEESLLWAWKSPKGNNYAIVPNPMKVCTGELYDEMKMIFAMSYENGIYKKYIVKIPAIFIIDERSHWQLKDPGVVELARQ